VQISIGSFKAPFDSCKKCYVYLEENLFLRLTATKIVSEQF